jgi:hypothetical protein
MTVSRLAARAFRPGIQSATPHRRILPERDVGGVSVPAHPCPGHDSPSVVSIRPEFSVKMEKMKGTLVAGPHHQEHLIIAPLRGTERHD